MNRSDSRASGSDRFEHRVWCSEDCTHTGKCQRQEETKFDRLYYWLRARQNHGSPSLSSMPTRIRRDFVELYAQLAAHLPGNNSHHLCDVSPAYAGIEAVVPYFARNPDKGHWLLEVTYHAHRAVSELEDSRYIPDNILSRAMDIATALTLTTERNLV